MSTLASSQNYRSRVISLYIYSTISAVIIISIIAISFTWNYFRERDHTIALAKKEALANFNKDVALRYWVTEHGGVYVPATEHTPPNPYLSNISERNITTPSGKKLTLMNPAYMIRQVMERYEKLYGIKGHITSLKLLNPENKPDRWEQWSLKAFERGVNETFEITSLHGKPFLRLMRPLITKKGCLKCHRHQGYKIGDVRGGIGVSLPLSSYYKLNNDTIYRLIVYHGLFALLGILAIVFITFQGKKGIAARKLAEDKIHKVNIELEQRVIQRTADLEDTNQKLNIKIHEHKQAEEQIISNLKEKEILLNEIHHRVKNNMTVISSLLKLQMNKIDNQIAKEALQDSQNRVQSMSMIHETLYRSDTLSAIDLKTYLSELGGTIFQNYSISNKVRFRVEAENIMISVKQASPVGLIVNELITNCLKYAFADVREGEILLELKSNKENEIELIISDNGVGMPEGFDLEKADSLGLKLIKLLAESQLDGLIDMESNNGTKFIIKFNIDKT
jgi:two-component sensor histidine kinase